MEHSRGTRVAAPRSSIDVWSLQCEDCLKWRIIPTQEEYEEIRRKIIEDPFVCSKKSNVSCNNPADMEYDNSRFAPNGRKFRAGTEVASFLKENPEYKDLSTSDFSFSVPKVMMDTVPVDAAKVESSGGSKRKFNPKMILAVEY
ncbi:methyl- -binding domain-containing 4-like [Olea europaea subsp. europaea]|uniref:Methyl- -binding domain-containing 4-like n=1 Tax=Olea europaea subsp. europaea TaxID=158383 RepID=A0A8S0PSP2_OLEEU|nr:methyl- -binding domain-containing 4-like [Olea europaea subsp. europaea]